MKLKIGNKIFQRSAGRIEIMRETMQRRMMQAKKRRKGNIKEEKREQNESLCLSGWAEGLQSLAGVLPLTAAAASVLYLQVVP